MFEQEQLTGLQAARLLGALVDGVVSGLYQHATHDTGLKAAETLSVAATGGYGSSPHIALAGFEQAAGVTFNPVHYKGGGPAVQSKIHQAASAVLKKPDVIAKIAAGSMDATPSASPQIFAAEVAAEAAVLEKLMQTLGAKVD